MLHHAEHARQAVADALAAQDHDRVGRRADVAGGHLAGQQVLQARLLRRDEQQRRDRRVLVQVGVDKLTVLPDRKTDLHAQRLGIAMDHLAVQLVEKKELDGVGR